jgi:hypothetical protein
MKAASGGVDKETGEKRVCLRVREEPVTNVLQQGSGLIKNANLCHPTQHGFGFSPLNGCQQLCVVLLRLISVTLGPLGQSFIQNRGVATVTGGANWLRQKTMIHIAHKLAAEIFHPVPRFRSQRLQHLLQTLFDRSHSARHRSSGPRRIVLRRKSLRSSPFAIVPTSIAGTSSNAYTFFEFEHESV